MDTTNPHVKAAIDYCGGKQSLLAERLGCAQQTVSKLLLGEIDIDPTWAVRLAKATDGRVPAVEACPDLAAAISPSDQRQDHGQDQQHGHGDSGALADVLDGASP